MKKISLSGNDINSSPPLSNSLESFRFKDEDNYEVRFDSKFICVLSKYRLLRKLHFTIIFTGNVSTVTFILKEVTPSPNRKMVKLQTFDILFPPLGHSR